MVETNHLPHLISLMVNDEFFQNLSKEEQEIITEAAKIATIYARKQSDERIADRMATIEESGTKILTLSDEVRNEVRESSQKIYDSIKENISEDIYNVYLRKK